MYRRTQMRKAMLRITHGTDFISSFNGNAGDLVLDMCEPALYIYGDGVNPDTGLSCPPAMKLAPQQDICSMLNSLPDAPDITGFELASDLCDVLQTLPNSPDINL